MSDDPEDVARRLPLRTAPRIACFNGDDPQYFLFIEDKTVLTMSSLSRAICFWFILHYVFNLEYCTQIKTVALFFQEFIFSLPATSYMKHQKSATYLTVTTDIQKFVV